MEYCNENGENSEEEEKKELQVENFISFAEAILSRNMLCLTYPFGIFEDEKLFLGAEVNSAD